MLTVLLCVYCFRIVVVLRFLLIVTAWLGPDLFLWRGWTCMVMDRSPMTCKSVSTGRQRQTLSVSRPSQLALGAGARRKLVLMSCCSRSRASQPVLAARAQLLVLQRAAIVTLHFHICDKFLKHPICHKYCFASACYKCHKIEFVTNTVICGFCSAGILRP